MAAAPAEHDRPAQEHVRFRDHARYRHVFGRYLAAGDGENSAGSDSVFADIAAAKVLHCFGGVQERRDIVKFRGLARA